MDGRRKEILDYVEVLIRFACLYIVSRFHDVQMNGLVLAIKYVVDHEL